MILTRENYFSKEAEELYMGSSSFKAYDMGHDGCEAKQIAIKNGEWTEPENKAFLVGSYVHAWSDSEEAFQKFCEENSASIFKKNKEKYADFVLADKIIETLKNDAAVELMRQGLKEQIFTGEIAGVPFKIQVDVLNHQKSYFADLKTTKSIYEKTWNPVTMQKENFIMKYDYPLQFAIYAEILRQNLGTSNYYDSYIIAVDKQDIPDHEIIFMGTDFIEEKLEEVAFKLPHIMAVKHGEIKPQRCEKCDYCKSTKKIKKPIHYLDL